MITTEIISAYLHTNLQLQRKSTGGIYTLEWVNRAGQIAVRQAMLVTENENPNEWLPILRPLSELRPELYKHDLTKETKNILIKNIIKQSVSAKLWNQLIADHYNVFNLPEGEFIKKV